MLGKRSDTTVYGCTFVCVANDAEETEGDGSEGKSDQRTFFRTCGTISVIDLGQGLRTRLHASLIDQCTCDIFKQSVGWIKSRSREASA